MSSSHASFQERIRGSLRLGRAARFVWRAGPGLTLASFFLVILQGLLPLLTLYLMKLIVDGVIMALGSTDKVAAFQQVIGFIALAGGAVLLNSAVSLVAALVKEAQLLTVSDYMYEILHQKSASVDLEYYETSRYFDKLHRAQEEAPGRPVRITDNLRTLGQSSVSLLAMVGLLSTFHWAMALVLFLAVIPGVLVKLRFSRRRYHWERDRTELRRKALNYSWMLISPEHAKENRIFSLGKLFIQRFADLRCRLRQEQLALARRRSVADIVAEGWAVLPMFAGLGFVAYRTVMGIITLGDMVMYYQALQRGLGHLRGLLGSLANLYEDNLFLNHLYEFLDLEPRVQESPRPRDVPRPMQQGITFEQVTFRYPTGQRQVLEEISLSIAPGEVVALVGENGSGKTTLIKLLCRFYDPQGGRITVDGIDLKDLSTDQLRRELSVIYQDFVRYDLTARENIWIGDTSLPPDHPRITEVARSAGAHEVITQLPEKYDNILGKLFEGGEEISLGEWQKVALARAFLRDSQLIVLDEPSSAMDARTELQIFTRLKQLLEGRSAILISHRFSTVRMADRIYVLEKGRIIEQGSHEELLTLDGTYADLFSKQAERYQ